MNYISSNSKLIFGKLEIVHIYCYLQICINQQYILWQLYSKWKVNADQPNEKTLLSLFLQLLYQN